MVKVKLMRAIATGATGLVLLGSTAAYAHGFNGPGWWFGGGSEASLDVDNDTDVDVDNDTDQHAYTGDAVVVAADEDDDCHFWQFCEDGDDEPAVLGDATTGAASNTNSTNVGVTITNSGPCDCLDNLEGDFNDVSVDVDNDTDVDIDNDTDQHASSGDATVVGGSEGSATTGDASNSNSTTITVNVSN